MHGRHSRLLALGHQPRTARCRRQCHRLARAPYARTSSACAHVVCVVQAIGDDNGRGPRTLALMWIAVERGTRRVQGMALGEPRPGSPALAGAARLSPEQAEVVVSGLTHDARVLASLRSLLHRAGLFSPAAAAPPSDDDVRALARRLSARGRITVLERPWIPLPVGDGEPDEAASAPTPIDVGRHSIAYRVIDNGTGEPYAGVSLKVLLPGGREVEQRTDADGWVKLDDVRPGRCDVRAERGGRSLAQVLAFVGMGPVIDGPAPSLVDEAFERPVFAALERVGRTKPARDSLAIARVLRHRVRDGDTLASIAEQHGLGVDELTQFNFGTSEPREVSAALSRLVGARKRNLRTGEVVLSSLDRPGVLFVPQPFEAPGQASDHDYVIRVSRLAHEPPPFVLSL